MSDHEPASKSTQDIFLRALEIPEADRPAMLDRECQGDAALRRDVESLLRYHRPESLLSVEASVRGSSGEHPLRPAGRITDGVTAAARKLLGGQKQRILAWLLAAAILGSVGYFAQTKVRESSEAQVREQLRVVLNADVLASQLWIDDWKQEANTWAQSPAVVSRAERLISQMGGDPEKARSLSGSPEMKEFYLMLKPFLEGPGQPQVILSDREGIRLGSGSRNNERSAAFAVPVLEGQTRFSPPSRRDAWLPARPEDSLSITFVSAPLRNSQGKVFGILTLIRDGEYGLDKILNVARMGESGETYAISPEGLMLTPSRFEKRLRELGLIPPRSEVSSALSVQVRDPGGDLTEGYKPAEELEARPLTLIARVALASRDKRPDQQTGALLEPYRDYRGREVVGTWKWLPEYDFAVLTEVDAVEAFASLRYVTRAFYILFGALGFSVALTLLSSITLARARRDSRQMGQYEISKQIGEGGTSKVYLAHHTLLKRPTAVKVLTPSEDLPQEAIRRFEREVRAACRLTHPNTIEIFDFGHTPEGTFYYAMEYLPGLTLADVVSLSGPLPVGRVITILRQVLASLREAHGQGLVHRDIKPQNIMLCQRGGEYDFVKVLDFGLVWNPDDEAETRITNPQRIVGTPLYMAPERFTSSLTPDVRSDIYSLGAVAYLLLSGRPIFRNVTGLELLGQVMHGFPDRLSELVPLLPIELEQLIMNSLSRDIAQRPASVAGMLEVLETIRDVLPWTRQMAQSWWERYAPGTFASSLQRRSASSQ